MPSEVSPVVCVGAAHWDILARAATPLGVGADVPGEVVQRPGGVAANVALALAAMDRTPTLLAAIGRDPDGEALVAALSAAGVDCRHVLRPLGNCDRYLGIETGDGALFAAVADCRGLEHAGPGLIRPLVEGPLRDFAGHLVVDGNLPADAVATLLRTPLPLTVVPASPEKAARLAPALGRAGVTFYTNRREAEMLIGTSFETAADAARALVARGARASLVTDGGGTAAWSDAAGTVGASPPETAVRSVTGAGDVLVAAHMVARDAGYGPADALAAALRAAASHAGRQS